MAIVWDCVCRLCSCVCVFACVCVQYVTSHVTWGWTSLELAALLVAITIRLCIMCVCVSVSDGCVYCGVRVCGSCFMAYFAALPLINIKSVNNNSNKSNKGASRRTQQKMLGLLATFSFLFFSLSSLPCMQNKMRKSLINSWQDAKQKNNQRGGRSGGVMLKLKEYWNKKMREPQSRCLSYSLSNLFASFRYLPTGYSSSYWVFSCPTPTGTSSN